ncbi:phage antirepressor KilAC domain-containing protein [Cupriavidus gilardii]|uniref:Phage antirepressor KilAC domain-containing protein n=1 Tax=Cupriavidus gilardii TaxID=82541 RepID=A0ABY4VW10_9BURK|nr:phage antirepressor KilAC domain-containing protein [Cupriavidus gilardii]USE78930.1 phage antirepressor KilAC domain-containing protein [Cupriavidus gilardii]
MTGNNPAQQIGLQALQQNSIATRREAGVDLLSIQGVDIRTDDAGRFCLNDLQRAATVGMNPRTVEVYEFMRRPETVELVTEISNTGNSRISPVETKRGNGGGTYVCKELVYAYAMWISPAFHLKVIRAFDDLVMGRAAPNFHIPQSLPEALRLAADLADKNAALTAVVAEQAPKVEALDRISAADGSLCIRDTAKALQVRPIDLTRWLQGHGWIYRRAGNGSWLGYQDKVQIGYLEHKVTTVSRSDGSDKVVEQVRVTPKGLTKLAQAIRADLACMDRVAA